MSAPTAVRSLHSARSIQGSEIEQVPASGGLKSLTSFLWPHDYPLYLGDYSRMNQDYPRSYICMNQNNLQSERRPDTALVRKKSDGSGSFLPGLVFAAGSFLILICSGLIVTYISEIITGTTRHGVASQMGLIVFLIGLVFVGWKMVQSRLHEKKAWKELREEQLILNRARDYAGSLTVSQTALDCQIAIADTKRAFERLSILGVCQVDVTDEGELCYRFPSLLLKGQSKNDHMLGTNLDLSAIESAKRPE